MQRRIGFRAVGNPAPFLTDAVLLGRLFEYIPHGFGLFQRPFPPFAINRFERRQIGISGAAR